MVTTMNGRTVIRVVSGVLMAPMFLLSVAVQYNDPDPIPWMLLYGAAFVVAVQAPLKRLEWRLAAAVAAIAAVWMVTLVPQAVEFLRSDHAPVAFYMKTGDALEEAARECGGLLLVFIWCSVLTWLGRKEPRMPAEAIS
jgi:Transmembrane family 220, helix